MGLGWGDFTVYARGCKAPAGYKLQCITRAGPSNANYAHATCPSGWQLTGCGINQHHRRWDKLSLFEAAHPSGNKCTCDSGLGSGRNTCYARCCKTAVDPHERTTKAKERSAKARAREQHSKAVERSSKERSSKVERSNKHKVAVERSNKSRLRVTKHWWNGWINGWDGNMNWQANGHTFVSGLRSVHDNGREDRLFSPLLTNIGSTQAHKHWSGWVNNMDAYYLYDCPNNYVLSGFISYHQNHYEDRRWRFQCARFHGLNARRDAHWPSWQTNWDATFHIGCGHRPVVGISSYHDNRKEDRRWRIRCGTFASRM